ncbi:2'-5' RNA ligase family protein [Terrimonas pollutisoli]|uniref:2'-5' RNA ligase family protein n=1 Tax=Terrimonas pollutisoli TaxID=3034147 RepID=UPI0023EBD069|nr:2'-5' RNA ligase family protein [Terrimonas sp. H1YJ31]
MIIRRQLTLFVNETEAVTIETIRSQYNPIQRELIDCHVTLCREDELLDMDQVLKNLLTLKEKAITIYFGPVTRFDNGRGVLLPATNDNKEFHHLRKQVLKGLNDNPRPQQPHITLMHPRNSTCTDEIFAAISEIKLPVQLHFTTLSLIEQVDGGRWKTLQVVALPGYNSFFTEGK